MNHRPLACGCVYGPKGPISQCDKHGGNHVAGVVVCKSCGLWSYRGRQLPNLEEFAAHEGLPAGEVQGAYDEWVAREKERIDEEQGEPSGA